MSTVNTIYTFNYSQPEEYHFSHDSVFFAQSIFEYVKNNPHYKVGAVADLCAGCGIVGMDLLFHINENKLPVPEACDFIEIQSIYENYYIENKNKLSAILAKEMNLNFINKNYADLSQDENYKSKYDLIVCNPPYFKVAQGKMSPSDFKNRCRFFIDSDFFNLIKFIKHSLNQKGCAFVLVKDLKDHKQSFDVIGLSFQLGLSAEKFCEVRGTDVFRIYK